MTAIVRHTGKAMGSFTKRLVEKAWLTGLLIAGLLIGVSSAGKGEVAIMDGNPVQNSEPAEPHRLNGSWVAEDLDAKIGEVTITLTFPDEGPMNIVAWSEIPFVGEVKNLTAPYVVQGDTISSKAIRGGTKARYGFEGEQLVLQFENGTTIRFHRTP